MTTYNPFGVNTVSSIVDGLMKQTSQAFSMDDRASLDAGNGRKGVRFQVSVGDGRGATRVNLTGDQIGGVVEALSAFRLDAGEPDNLPPGEVVKRTIKVDKGEVTFRLTLAKNAREVSIPVNEWASFLDYMSRVDQWTEGAVAHFRSVVEASEAK